MKRCRMVLELTMLLATVALPAVSWAAERSPHAGKTVSVADFGATGNGQRATGRRTGDPESAR